MAAQADLFMGPRDGETVNIVEPVKTIEIMVSPKDTAIYERESHTAPGVFKYTYQGMKEGDA